ncbi:MAG: hypothetical protein E7653_04020 [Ruminococcaceae bacterium]|nr:hypothetical protein [Oscillospiraceae bacterium]
MKKVYIDKAWKLKENSIGEIAATVPGCVHTDLLAANIIGDPFWRDENLKYQWIEERDWEYSTRFDAQTDNARALVFEGLDTYAEIYLNGALLGKTENMFIPHSFDIRGALREKDNELRVVFRSPVKAVEGLPKLKAAFTAERLHSRRVQCTYGWDWVDRFVTAGIWKPVYLAYDNGIDIESVYVYTDNADKYGAQIVAEMYFENIQEGQMASVEIVSPDGETVAGTQFFADMEEAVRRFDIASPKLWYPAGYGEQPLYRFILTVGENRNEHLFGIRTLKIVQLPDGEGSENYAKAMAAQETKSGKLYSKNTEFSGFFVVVNGVRINCKGANWVPCEPFMSAESDQKIRTVIRRSADMGANFIRVWGGGIFEHESFYDECDKLGMLVAQDFLMACGDYPEKEEWFIEELKKEAEFAAKYLRNHTCLAWWHGDNENAVKGSDTQEDYVGRDSALRGIAPAIYKHDHTRQLLPSSPYGGETYASVTKGTAHNTNYIHLMFRYFLESDCKDYKEYLENYTARFISEEPVFGAVNRSSALKFMSEDDLLRDESEEMIYFHTKSNPGLKTHLFTSVSEFARKIFGDFEDGEDKFFKYKYVQYEWVRTVFENARRNLGYCDGMIFWMLNDCWPAFGGWSFIDYYNMPKQAFYAFKRCAKDVVGSVVKTDKGYELCISNDTDRAIYVNVTARVLGSEAHPVKLAVVSKAYSVKRVTLPFEPCEGSVVVCDLDTPHIADRCFYKDGDLALTRADKMLCVLERTENSITLKADGYIHTVELEGEYLLDDNCFSMLAGETRTVKITPLSADMTLDIHAYTLK